MAVERHEEQKGDQQLNCLVRSSSSPGVPGCPGGSDHTPDVLLEHLRPLRLNFELRSQVADELVNTRSRAEVESV